MTPLKVASHARALGIILRSEGGKLTFEASAGVMNGDISRCLKAMKQDLLKLLVSKTLCEVVQILGDLAQGSTDPDVIDRMDGMRDELSDWFDERAGIHEFDGNCSRDAAEMMALKELQGELLRLFC